MKRSCLIVLSLLYSFLFLASAHADSLYVTDYFAISLPDNNLTFIGENEIQKANTALYNGGANYENAFFLSFDTDRNITWTAHIDDGIFTDEVIMNFTSADAEVLLDELSNLYSSDANVTYYTSGVLPHTQGSLVSYELCADYKDVTVAMIAYIGFINIDNNWKTIQITASRSAPFSTDDVTYADTVVFGKTLFDGTLLTIE